MDPTNSPTPHCKKMRLRSHNGDNPLFCGGTGNRVINGLRRSVTVTDMDDPWDELWQPGKIAASHI